MDIESLWDYSDPEGSEARFRGMMAKDTDPFVLAELTTQIARTMSLRRRFQEANDLLDGVESSDAMSNARVRVRYLLERGRTFNSSNQKELAKPLFLQAYDLGSASGEEFLAADAAHMVAIASDGEEAIDWNLRTIEVARRSTDPKAKKWIASAGNNLGWSYHGLGQFEEALEQFEDALEARQGGPVENILIALWCVARCLRSLGRVDQSLEIQLELEAERDKLGKPGGFVFEEIGECLLASGRDDESRPYFSRAFDFLSQDEWLVEDEPQRLERIKSLA